MDPLFLQSSQSVSCVHSDRPTKVVAHGSHFGLDLPAACCLFSLMKGSLKRESASDATTIPYVAAEVRPPCHQKERW